MGESLKWKFSSVTRNSGSLGDPNCLPYVMKAEAVKTLIEKTDGCMGSILGIGGVASKREFSIQESSENYYDHNNH